MYFVGGSSNARYCVVTGANADRMLELLDGTPVTVRGEPFTVDLSHKGIVSTLKRKSNGATLSVSSPGRLLVTSQWVYLMGNEKLFRAATGDASQQSALLSMLDWEEPLFIRESDIPQVCRRLLPILREAGQLVTRGIDPEASGAETPSFRFDLDYTDEGRLVCAPYALYPRSGGEYRLYDDQTGRGIRDPRAEQEAAALCARSFEDMDRETLTLSAPVDQEGLYDFLRNELPRLEQLGTVRATDRVHSRAVMRLPHVSVGVSLAGRELVLDLKGADMSPEELA